MNHLPYPRYKAWAADGVTPGAGFKLYTYETDGVTEKAVYADVELTNAHPNPVIMDSNGEKDIFLGRGSYELILYSDTDELINTFGPVTSDSDTEDTTFDVSLIGCTTVPTGVVKVNRIGKMVTLLIPTMSGTSNSAALTLTGLPANLQPVTEQSIQGADCKDNGTIYPAALVIGPSGTITVKFKNAFVNAPAGTFTTSGAKGLTNGVATFFTITYSLL